VNIIILLLFTIILFLVIVQKVETKKIDVKVGDIAPFEIRATKEIEDKIATEQLKTRVANNVEPKYRLSPSVQMTMKQNIKEFFNKVRKLKADESLTFNEKIEVLGEESRILLSKNEYYIAL